MTRKTTIAHPDEISIGQDHSIAIGNSAGAVEDARDELSEIEVVGTPNFEEHARNLAFMEEVVEVTVHTSTDPNAERFVDVYNNGTVQRFERGVPIRAKRKYVEVLARAKPFSVTTPNGIDGNNQATTNIQTRTALRYPFEMKDANSRGHAWLQGVLKEA